MQEAGAGQCWDIRVCLILIRAHLPTYLRQSQWGPLSVLWSLAPHDGTLHHCNSPPGRAAQSSCRPEVPPLTTTQCQCPRRWFSEGPGEFLINAHRGILGLTFPFVGGSLMYIWLILSLLGADNQLYTLNAPTKTKPGLLITLYPMTFQNLTFDLTIENGEHE